MLRSKRKARRLSQKEAARMLNIKNTYLSLIETKKRTNLKIELIDKICKFYDIELQSFLEWLKEK